jgi:hypothetical protein
MIIRYSIAIKFNLVASATIIELSFDKKWAAIKPPINIPPTKKQIPNLFFPVIFKIRDVSRNTNCTNMPH